MNGLLGKPVAHMYNVQSSSLILLVILIHHLHGMCHYLQAASTLSSNVFMEYCDAFQHFALDADEEVRL